MASFDEYDSITAICNNITDILLPWIEVLFKNKNVTYINLVRVNSYNFELYSSESDRIVFSTKSNSALIPIFENSNIANAMFRELEFKYGLDAKMEGECDIKIQRFK